MMTLTAHTVPGPAAPSTDARREDWLTRFARLARPTYEANGLQLPDNLRIGVGWLGVSTLGVCWDTCVTTDGATEVTIAPRHDGAVMVAGILSHELIHAAGIKGHRKDFADAGKPLGLVGKPTMMCFAGLDRAPDWADTIIQRLGPYPAGRINLTGKIATGESDKPRGSVPRGYGPSGKPKQSTRMLKAECELCGLTFRISRKWAEKATHCPDSWCDGHIKVAV